MATGIEKLSKLTLMAEHEARTGVLKTDGEMRAKRGHQVEYLSNEVVKIIARHDDESGNAYLASLRAALSADPNWPKLVSLLDQAADAKEGRYRHARAMSGDMPETESPATQWDALGLRVAISRGLLSQLASAEGSKTASAAINMELLRPVVRWWHLVYRGWGHGVAGERGRQNAPEIKLEVDNLPPELRAFVEAL